MKNSLSRRIAWIGPHADTELTPCRDAIIREAQLVEGDADLTVYACPRPLADTSRLAELATGDGPVVQLLGVWCEGEQRTGRTVEGVERVFWHAWSGWLQRWLARPRFKAAVPPGLVRVDTRDHELAASIVDTLAAHGVAAAWGPAVTTRPAVIVWDGTQFGGVEANRLASLCHQARLQGARVIALLDFPRPETLAAARAIGAEVVLGKPVAADALYQAIAINAPRESHSSTFGRTLKAPPTAATAQAA